MVEAIAEKKGEDIILMDIREMAVFADYFVICSGTSERQLKALVEGIDEMVRQKYRAHPRRTEGDTLSGWILMDYTDVIVHIFAPHQRDFYQLEELWKEAPVILKMQ
jgi:ribosome-associated protein